MKVYLISHDGVPSPLKLEAWVDIDKVGSNGVYVKSVRAFPKKKEAKAWLAEKGWTHLVIKTANLENV